MNSILHRVRVIEWRVCAAVFLSAAASASAQSVYKEVDAAGHVTYTNRPRPPAPPPVAATPADDVRNALDTNTALSSRLATMIDAKEAARRLRETRLRRAQGKQRLPSEQARGADANAANDRYRRRQEELWRAVERAERRLDETRQSQR